MVARFWRTPMKMNYAVLAAIVLSMLTACRRESVVSYETVRGFRLARGSTMTGYSGAALNEATRLSEVRQACGTPLAEWEENVPFFAKVKRLRYKTYDVHGNTLSTTFTFVMTSSDPSLISIDSG